MARGPEMYVAGTKASARKGVPMFEPEGLQITIAISVEEAQQVGIPRVNEFVEALHALVKEHRAKWRKAKLGGNNNSAGWSSSSSSGS